MPRIRTSLSIEAELLEWVDKEVERNYEFRDRSHFFEVLAYRYKEKLEIKD